MLKMINARILLAISILILTFVSCGNSKKEESQERLTKFHKIVKTYYPYFKEVDGKQMHLADING